MVVYKIFSFYFFAIFFDSINNNNKFNQQQQQEMKVQIKIPDENMLNASQPVSQQKPGNKVLKHKLEWEIDVKHLESIKLSRVWPKIIQQNRIKQNKNCLANIQYIVFSLTSSQLTSPNLTLP